MKSGTATPDCAALHPGYTPLIGGSPVRFWQLLDGCKALRCNRRATIIYMPTRTGGNVMAWTTPTLVEICIGLEINGYLPAEF
jgi:coenzyme PQQ precursor peptide PqqA